MTPESAAPSAGPRRFLTRILVRREFPESTFLILLSIVVGVGGALASIGFERGVHLLLRLVGRLSGRLAEADPLWRYLAALIPALGGLAVGLLYRLNATIRDQGIPHIMLAVAKQGGVVSSRNTLFKFIASIITIGSGGSAGPEGPMVVIGAGIGSRIGQSLRISGERLKILVACGSAAALSAIFNAPIAGVMFALEAILGSFSTGFFAPVVISSVISSAVSRSLLGDHPAFAVPRYAVVSHWHLIHYSLLGVVCALLSVAFIHVLYRTEDLFAGMKKIPPALKPALGGLLVGVAGVWFPQVLGIGYDTIRAALFGQLGLQLMLVLLVLKLLSTSVSLGSGGSGGTFAPLLFLGAMVGGAFGYLAGAAPLLTITDPQSQIGAFALVGASAMLAGAGRTPLTAIMMVFELTSDYRLILPIMIASVVSLLVSRSLHHDSIYTTKLTRLGEQIQHGADLSVLSRITVEEVYDRRPDTLREDDPLERIMTVLRTSRFSDLPVLDGDGRLAGIIAFQHLRTVLQSHELDQLVLARDVLTEEIRALTPRENLIEALRQFDLQGLDHLPVVSPADPTLLLGLLTRSDVMDRYNKELLIQQEYR